jgi:hypothetical protein
MKVMRGVLKYHPPQQEGPEDHQMGEKGDGNFHIKEAYQEAMGLDNEANNPLWSKVWNPQIWPKVATFLWLVVNKRALTWDRVVKRGFTGPSICLLCNQAEETLNHLLNSCPLDSNIWDIGAILFRRSYRNRQDISMTISDWKTDPYQNPILNRAWMLFLGLVLWNV